MGVHLSFVRSVGMDSWNATQLKKMQLGGNAKVNQFLAKHGVPKDAPIHLKYDSAAAEAFREKIRVEADGGKYAEPANIPKGLKQNTGGNAGASTNRVRERTNAGEFERDDGNGKSIEPE